MIKKLLLWVFIGLVLFGLYTYIDYQTEDLRALETAQQSSTDAFIEHNGMLTRYQLHGEQQQSTIVLIHSFNGFLESWQPNVDALVKAGFRVVTYDLYGRGLSDRPQKAYDLSLLRAQLKALINSVNASQVHLVGASFGSVIAADYAQMYPGEVLSLSFIGPAGWPEPGARSALLDLPLLGDLVFHYWGKTILKPKVEAYFLDPSDHLDVIQQWDGYADLPGFTRASLSMLRHAPVFDYTAGWQQLGKQDTPVLFVWGKDDVSFPFHHTEKIPAYIPHAVVKAIDDAAHWVNIEKAQQVNTELIDFIQSF